jgi:unsaturated rhamnogalacturonyl hydrolase
MMILRKHTRKIKFSLILLIAVIRTIDADAQLPVRSWVDSVAVYGMERCMPPEKFRWDWNQAVMLNSIIHLYREATPGQRTVYMDYIRNCMDRTAGKASGRHPNVCAPAHGMVFLYGELGEKTYWNKAMKVWYEYLLIPRARNYGASHRDDTVELWDDTVYMLSMFFLEIYRQTGDEKYLRELMTQYYAHAEMLADKETGLWVHGWDADDIDYNDHCSRFGWADMVTRRSHEMWGRGNGWIVMTLADVLEALPKGHPIREEAAQELIKMTHRLPEWQDPQTGMWYQLPARYHEDGNYPEGSCTAMFAYAITIGVKQGVLDRDIYKPLTDKAYYGLRRYAMVDKGEGYLSPDKVCIGTCIGDKNYYFDRRTASGIDFAVGLYVMFGLEYEKQNGLRSDKTSRK